jgi:hypothetical protein
LIPIMMTLASGFPARHLGCDVAETSMATGRGWQDRLAAAAHF